MSIEIYKHTDCLFWHQSLTIAVDIFIQKEKNLIVSPRVVIFSFCYTYLLYSSILLFNIFG